MKSFFTAIAMAACGLVALLGACSPVGKLTRPDLELPEAIAPGATDSATIADVAWWTFYGDSTLCRMIERALAHNRTFASAIARVEAARQQFKGVRADQWPKISATVGASRETNDYYNERFINDPEYDLKASLQWELDLWGKRRNAAKAANADYRATLDDMRAVQMELVADVATAYYHLMALDSELAIVRRTLVNRQEAVDKAKLRFEGGLTSELVYQQAIVEFAATADLVPLLESRIAACENALSTLMGEFPQREGHIERTAIAQAAMTTDSDLPLGLPASLLARRPDISALAERMTAAAARVGVAWANRLPTLGISITGGWENDDANRLISSPFSLLAASLTGPVFDFGSRKASQNKAVAEYEQARLAYEQGVLVAFREAADALMNYRKSRQSRALKAQSQRAAGKYLHLATLQYEGGTTNYMDVLDAQRRNFSAQIDYSNALRDESLALISLYKALGGGW